MSGEKSLAIINWVRAHMITVIIVVIILILFNAGIHKVDSGHKGLRFTMGALENREIGEGIVYIIPFIQSLEKITIQPQELSYTITTGTDAAISKDNQSIGATISIFYKYIEGQLVDMRRNTGEKQVREILKQTSFEQFKQVIGAYTIFDVASQQDDISRSLFSAVESKLNLPVRIEKLLITNYDWSDQFENQIEQTMKRAQEVKQKEQELLIAEQEAQKKVKEAQADSSAQVARAGGEYTSAKLLADAKKEEGRGISEYNEQIMKYADFEIRLRELAIRELEMKRWNGAFVPTNNYGPIPVQTGSLQPAGK